MSSFSDLINNTFKECIPYLISPLHLKAKIGGFPIEVVDVSEIKKRKLIMGSILKLFPSFIHQRDDLDLMITRIKKNMQIEDEDLIVDCIETLFNNNLQPLVDESQFSTIEYVDEEEIDLPFSEFLEKYPHLCHKLPSSDQYLIMIDKSDIESEKIRSMTFLLPNGYRGCLTSIAEKKIFFGIKETIDFLTPISNNNYGPNAENL